MNDRINMNRLNHKDVSIPVGITWGVPWKEGALLRDEPIALNDGNGIGQPIQSWPTAYWPDGSVKWTAHAAVCTPEDAEGYTLGKGEPAFPEAALSVTETDDVITVHTGNMLCELNRNGPSVVKSIRIHDNVICTGGKLIGIVEKRQGEEGSRTLQEQSFESLLSQVSIEQNGPVRAVIRMEGMHQTDAGRKWLPFILRFVFYAGTDSVTIMHSFIYDGDAQQDFIKGLGLAFTGPISGELYNRHVRIAGDSGFFKEPARLIATRKFGDGNGLYESQITGEALDLNDESNKALLRQVENGAIWNSFKIVQDSSDHYRIQKRTKPGCAWIDAAHGHRSGGLLYAGGESGGLAASVRNLWEKYPSALEIHQLATDEILLKVWLWSPDGGAMDMRHYDTETHVEAAYEGFDELRSTPNGVANTSEIRLWCFESLPTVGVLESLVSETRSPSLLVCEPEHYYNARVFGVWSLVDRSSEGKAWVEDQLDEALQFYLEEVEQRRWYGFWNYGDVMHTYDAMRHTWRYDMGGYAWQNSELVPNMWLWYSFLRSGREDIFRLAEAMTRHTSEVDVYHLGEYAGLGSRHNVIHWGCGCKEARISMAGLHRMYYYLTGDERTGDLMREVKDSDYAVANLDPMRFYFPKDEHPTHVRSGPDWAAFCSNWLTEWERFEDTTYRDKMMEGISNLKQMPFGLCSGPTFGYDPKTGTLSHMGENGESNYSYHMMIAFGAPETWLEIAGLIKDPAWNSLLADFGQFYVLEDSEKLRRSAGKIQPDRWPSATFAARLTAYASVMKKDPELARKAWGLLLDDDKIRVRLPIKRVPADAGAYIKPVKEIPWATTNSITQWALNAIQCLELIGDVIPEERLKR